VSEQNVATVREGFVAFNARDVERLVALSDPDCEWLPFRAQLEGMTYRGHSGIRQFVQDMDDDWDDFRIEPMEFHDREDWVAVVGCVTARGRGSGVDVDSVAGFVFELQSGRMARVVSYSDPEAALAAVGAAEQP
jgi:ketosteroid isomerase-like protein